MPLTEDIGEGTVLQRLNRIEHKLDRLEDRIEATTSEAIGLRKTALDTAHSIRELQDWRVEMTAYLRQVRWILVVAGAAVVVGVINLALELAQH